MSYHRLGRRRMVDGLLEEFVGEGVVYLHVCRHCDKCATVMHICDELYAGDATINRKNCSRWKSLQKAERGD